jgi:hypothetical protein
MLFILKDEKWINMSLTSMKQVNQYNAAIDVIKITMLFKKNNDPISFNMRIVHYIYSMLVSIRLVT